VVWCSDKNYGKIKFRDSLVIHVSLNWIDISGASFVEQFPIIELLSQCSKLVHGENKIGGVF